MERYYLAVDIGASSGRHILSHRKDGKMVIEEIYRFPNGMTNTNGHLIWDTDRLFHEIISGMKRCKLLGKIPESISIDTWAVDYVLLDKSGKRIGLANAYRDKRTEGMDKEVYKIIDEESLYKRTGIQKQPFNTIYQLMASKKYEPEVLNNADMLLMIPDYFHYLLTGNAVTEYTNATTTQLVNPITKQWDMELIHKLGFPERIFKEIKLPGFHLGRLKEAIAEEVGYECNVVLPATHDTGSAVMAVPSIVEQTFYISSGTWSLMGTERPEADCTSKSRIHNLTNEGGYDFRFRYLKNIMGLWMIQSVKKELGEGITFGQICDGAAKCSISSIVDCNHNRFLAPDSMVTEIQHACLETKQEVPAGLYETAAVIYNSLACCYAKTKQEIEELSGIHYNKIHIIGGGANADYLNRLTANKTNCTVYAGPSEATSIGNIMAQMIAAGEFKDLRSARKCVLESFEINIYEPERNVKEKITI